MDSSSLFLKSIDLLIDKLDYLKVSFLKLLQDKETCISTEKLNDYVYHFMIYNEDHTMGNLIQSHIVRRCLSDESILQFCAYKKPHPLEESIKLIVSINPSHKVTKENDLRKFQSIVNFLIEELENIKKELKILYKAGEEAF
jgi:DNA-directed RNA polymerase subunit L